MGNRIHSLAAVIVILAILGALSSGIPPPTPYLVAELLITAVLSALPWKPFVKLHTRLQIALIDTLKDEPPSSH